MSEPAKMQYRIPEKFIFQAETCEIVDMHKPSCKMRILLLHNHFPASAVWGKEQRRTSKRGTPLCVLYFSAVVFFVVFLRVAGFFGASAGFSAVFLGDFRVVGFFSPAGFLAEPRAGFFSGSFSAFTGSSAIFSSGGRMAFSFRTKQVRAGMYSSI